MNNFLLTMLLLLPAHMAFPQGQVAPERPAQRIVTRTRLVAIFSDLENQLFKNLQDKNDHELSALLSEEFQLWTPTPPGDPVPRDDWQKQALSENMTTFRIRQMAARSIDENSVLVHFVLSRTLQRAGKSVPSEYFVVDLWQKNGEKWQLSDRYASPVAASHSKPRALRPTGKN
jgi:hypothetical protein